MSNLWYLENINLIKILCPHKYKRYKNSHSFNQYGKKDYIYFEQDTSNKIFLIDKGKVKLGYYTEDGNEVVNAILGKGELFGEKAILGEEKRNEFAQSIDNKTSICPIKVSSLYDLMRNNGKITINIYKIIGFKIKKLERRLQLLLFKDVKTRLLEFINELSEDYGVYSEKIGKIKIQHPYTQKDIANLIGTSRPTLNIVMNELKDEGIIDFRRKEIDLIKKN